MSCNCSKYKKELPLNVIYQAASLCAKFSVDFDGVYEVDFYTKKKCKIQSGANVLYNPYNTTVVKIKKKIIINFIFINPKKKG